jgi:nucleotide-binding universal stress UspA family protein
VPRALPLDADLPDEVVKGEAALAHAEALARGPDTIIESELLQARSIGAAIVDEATERHADLIVLGAQYRRRLGEFNMGVTLPYVLKNAPCRVLVARAPHPTAPAPAGAGALAHGPALVGAASNGQRR